MTSSSRLNCDDATAAASSPDVVVFDVNQTLSDMSPMGARFTDVGAPEGLAATWFASLLRDGFALAAAGSSAPFAQIGAGVLRGLLEGLPLQGSTDAAVEHIMAGFAQLELHGDVPDGVRAMAGLGVRLVTLSNGSTDVAQELFDRAGVTEHFDRLLSVQDAGVWKPAAASYEYAGSVCGVAADRMLMVAVHPWDVDGAHRAGLRTAWINRAGASYPEYLARPDLQATTLVELAGLLTR